MIHQDLFVGGVAVALGVVLVFVAAINSEWYFQLRKAQWLEARLGRTGARCLYGLVGLALIALGVAIAAGFGPNASRRNAFRRVGPQGCLANRPIDRYHGRL